MSLKTQIEDFKNSKRIAVVGISSHKKFGNSVFTELNARGYELYPVHPSLTEFRGIKCYSDLLSVPDYVDSLYIVCSRENTLKTMISANKKKTFGKIWVQQHCDSKDLLKYINNEGINAITGQCLFMHLENSGNVHKFHRGIMKLFGKFPK